MLPSVCVCHVHAYIEMYTQSHTHSPSLPGQSRKPWHPQCLVHSYFSSFITGRITHCAPSFSVTQVLPLGPLIPKLCCC